MDSSKVILYRLLNIKYSERKTVTNLFFHHFLQGFGLAIVFIVANTIFLTQYSVNELPIVYIFSGFIMIVTGRIYAVFENQMAIKKLLKSVVLFVSILLIVLWLSGNIFNLGIFAFVLLVSYQLLYLLSNLEFWGLSALVFNVRQGKRLFGLISAGDVPAKMLGYLVVSFMATLVDLPQLLFLSAISVFLSYFFLQRILSQQNLQEKTSRDIHKHYMKQKLATHPLGYLKSYFKTPFILVAAFLSFIAVITLAIINFSFLAEVKFQYKTDTELASFFGLFFAVGQFLIIFIKSFFSGRVIGWLGIKKGLLILPITIIIILIVSFTLNGIGDSYKNMLYIFGFLMLFTEILKYAVHQPLFLSLFQPLNAHLRLHGHTVIKGFVDGIGLIISGIVLLIMLNFETDNRLISFGIVILFFALIWIGCVFIVDSGYIKLLREAINIRRLTGSELHITDDRVYNKILDRLKNGKPWEVIYGLEILKKNKSHHYQNSLIEAIKHSSSDVRNWSYFNLNDSHFYENLEFYRKVVFSTDIANTEKYTLLKKLTRIDPDAHSWAEPLLFEEDSKTVSSIIEGLLQGKSIEGMVIAGSRLIELKTSKSIHDKKTVCEIIGNLQLNNFHKIIADYIDCENPELIDKAVKTAGILQHQELFTGLINKFKQQPDNTNLLESISSYKIYAIDYFTKNIKQFSDNKLHLEAIILIARQNPHIKSMFLLLNHYFLSNVELRNKSLEVISGYKNINTSEDCKDIANHWLKIEIDFLKSITEQYHSSKNHDVFQKILENERIQTQKRIFGCLCILYPSSELNKTKVAYFSHYSNKRANALERLEDVLSKKWANKVIPVLEIYAKPSINSDSMEKLIKMILSTGHSFFNTWTIARTLKQCSQIENDLCNKYINQWISDKNLIISQQAKIINNKNLTPMKNTIHVETELQEVEKVSILKGTKLFGNTPENLLVDLASLLKTVRIEKGDILFNEGDPGNSMYIVHSGSIEIKDKLKVLAHFKELDFFGELSLLDDEPRSATAIASKNSLLLSINQEDFYELITFRQEVARSVLRVLSQRLRRQNKT